MPRELAKSPEPYEMRGTPLFKNVTELASVWKFSWQRWGEKDNKGIMFLFGFLLFLCSSSPVLLLAPMMDITLLSITGTAPELCYH